MHVVFKNEETRRNTLGDCKSRIKFNPENIQRVVSRVAYCVHRNSNGNLYVRYLYWNDGQWNWNYNWLDNDFDDQYPAAISASLFRTTPLLLSRGVLFCELTVPPS